MIWAKVRFPRAVKVTSKSFDTYCASLGIKVEHPVAYVHTQNGLAKSLIKHIQTIARTLLLRTNLNDTAWGHAILHASALIRLPPTTSLLQSPLQMVLGYEPDISHLRSFGCAVQVPIAPQKRTKMDP